MMLGLARGLIFPHSWLFFFFFTCQFCFMSPLLLVFLFLLPGTSHLSRGDTKSGRNMCRAGAPRGGESSSLVWKKAGRAKRSRITETIWDFCCPLSHCLELNIPHPPPTPPPRVHSTQKPQQKQRGSDIRAFKRMERRAASLCLIWWVAVLSVLTQVAEQFEIKATAKKVHFALVQGQIFCAGCDGNSKRW